jgi:hypothetical protein
MEPYNTNLYSSYYTSGDKNKLSVLLQDKGIRAGFETWLLDTYSNHDLSKNFHWNCQLIELLCKSRNIDDLSTSEAEKEDIILAKLINKNIPIEEKTVTKITKIFSSYLPKNYSESLNEYF